VTTVSIHQTAASEVYLDRLRDESRGRVTFRDSLGNITTLLVADALATLGDPAGVLLVPIIRGGLGMVDGALAAAPSATVGHIGVYRDPTTHDVVEYYSKIPELPGAPAVLLDPMLATGGTVFAAAGSLAAAGYDEVHVATVIASNTAIELLSGVSAVRHIFTCAVDDGEPEVGALSNGLGDAGARLYGTP
jgi:uracil phosphoribosyltransferase